MLEIGMKIADTLIIMLLDVLIGVANTCTYALLQKGMSFWTKVYLRYKLFVVVKPLPVDLII